MENQLRFALMLSLEQMALRRVAVALYSNLRVLASIANFRLRPGLEYRNIWNTKDNICLKDSDDTYWRRAVIDAVPELRLTESHGKQMAPTVRAVGLEIYTWKSIHAEYFGSCIDVQVACLQRLCWTRAGVVDYRRTAEQLVRFNTLDVEARFRLACLYCLQDSLQLLWEELCDSRKKKFSRGIKKKGPRPVPNLQLHLSRILKEHTEIESEWSHSSTFFEKAAMCGHKTAAEFFLGKLTREQREASLVRTAENVIRIRYSYHRNKSDFRVLRLSGVLHYLLSQMTPEEQMGIFRELPCGVLICFLDWPLQDLFSDIADVIWTFIPESEYQRLVFTIGQSMHDSGYYFPTVFQTLFLRSPKKFQKGLNHFFWNFFNEEDTETIRLLVRSLDAADRERLVFSKKGLDIIYYYEHKWRAVEAFLGAAALSEEDKRRLKEDFEALLERRERIHLAREEHGKFFEYVEGRGGVSAAEPERRARGKRTRTENSSVKTKKTRSSRRRRRQ